VFAALSATLTCKASFVTVSMAPSCKNNTKQIKNKRGQGRNKRGKCSLEAKNQTQLAQLVEAAPELHSRLVKLLSCVA